LSKLFITQTYHYKILNRITNNNNYNFEENLNWNSSSDYSSSSYINSKYVNHIVEKVKSSRKQKSAEKQNFRIREIILNYLIKNNFVIAAFLTTYDKNNEI